MTDFGNHLQRQLLAATPQQQEWLQKIGAQANPVLARIKAFEQQVHAARVLSTGGIQAAGLATAGMVGYGILTLYEHLCHTYETLKETFLPYKNIAQPCLPCLDIDSAAMRQLRIEKRQKLLQEAQKHSTDPTTTRAAQCLSEDMHAVELARLSDNSYYQFDKDKNNQEKKPPAPWQAMSKEQAKVIGIEPQLLETAKAVIYQAPPHYPFTPKVVVAFRGTTTDREDILTDHDQAIGLKTAQYEAACQLGQQLGQHLPSAEVTGHSLGGGKAQAAGVAGGLKGMMFNSAGLHPKSVGLGVEALQVHAQQFKQYRADGGFGQGGGDPLTGLQNSPELQKTAYEGIQGLQTLAQNTQQALGIFGIKESSKFLPEDQVQLAQQLAQRILSVTPQEVANNKIFSQGSWHIPPAIGGIINIKSKKPDGSDASIAEQHALGPLIHGIEHRKSENIQTLLKRTGHTGSLSDYLGPTHLS